MSSYQMRGEIAYRRVREYSDLGWHRTGSDTEQATLTWLENQLSNVSTHLFRQEFDYLHFQGQSSVMSGGREIESMPLHYSATGSFKLIRPLIAKVDAQADESDIEISLRNLIKVAASGENDGILVSTDGKTSGLVAINRDSESRIEMPVILLPGSCFQEITETQPQVEIESSLYPGKSSNLVARIRDISEGQALVITTPVSGWFNCAGERGTGIAIALALAEKLRSRYPLDLMFASGHELGFLGGLHLSSHYCETPACVVHLGSCIANLDTQLETVLSAPGSCYQAISESLSCLQPSMRSVLEATDPKAWIGESKCWASHNRPMLSIAGQAPHFHCTTDLPEQICNADKLNEAIEAIIAAVELLAASVTPDAV